MDGVHAAGPTVLINGANQVPGIGMSSRSVQEPPHPCTAPPSTENELLAVIELAAIAHGEWVRIHPYANGNGRTARVWANWVAMRYGLPPFVRIKPRPDGLLYAQGAQRSMGLAPDFAADHDLTLSVILDLLRHRP